jgi:hypothetical protein
METTKQIRTELKKLGYNSRKIGVITKNTGYSTAIYIKIKDKNIDKKEISKITKKYKKVDRCQHTHDILSGGNIFIFVDYQ